MPPKTLDEPTLLPRGNPLGAFSPWKLVTIVFMVLNAAGVPDFLRAKAAATDNNIDDALASAVATLIEKLAAL